METMKCIKCGLEKELTIDNFYWRSDTQKWKNCCKICLSTINKKKYGENSEVIRKRSSEYKATNKDIVNARATIYNNKKENKKRSAKWRQANKERIRQREKEWILKNPDKYKKIASKKSKKQSQKLTYKIRRNISRSINFVIQKMGKSKERNSITKYLPYSINELKIHLEKQFESWMTWNNYGSYRIDTWNDNDSSTWTWQIDHIIPHSTFNYSSMEEQSFRDCWSLNNLRPYSAKQNITDGSQRIRHK